MFLRLRNSITGSDIAYDGLGHVMDERELHQPFRSKAQMTGYKHGHNRHPIHMVTDRFRKIDSMIEPASSFCSLETTTEQKELQNPYRSHRTIPFTCSNSIIIHITPPCPRPTTNIPRNRKDDRLCGAWTPNSVPKLTSSAPRWSPHLSNRRGTSQCTRRIPCGRHDKGAAGRRCDRRCSFHHLGRRHLRRRAACTSCKSCRHPTGASGMLQR
mmetsp:Transcript_11973/g.24381  ORF Transcript_11973/g.24381 Transcript_11973/m.24381 type:complete len:213 (+) Transcript_11973:1579-2217(+)